jgi:alginate O-acetyltransferase complex protein AlgI
MSGRLPLLSPEFLGFAILTILLVVMTRGNTRQIVFLFANIAFLGGLLLGPVGTVSTIGFVMLGWALIRWSEKSPQWCLKLGIPAYVLLFIYMRNYAFLHWVVPEFLLTDLLATIGLSFLLFKILHMVIEAQGGTLGRVEFMNYLNYCFNFTTFMMGPIQRFQDYREQWTGERDAIPRTLESHLDAVIRILFGLFRVYVLGAWLQPYMMVWGTDVASASFFEILIQVYAFFFFLYFNFGGYCDVAIGLGSLMGVRPPENFNLPFLARNASDFWLRQHRSLTLWLTDFVFSPTLKSCLRNPRLRRHSAVAVSLSLMLTMFVSGIWHGTTVGFLLFGLMHGLLLVTYHLWNTWLKHRLGRAGLEKWRKNPLVIAGSIFLTFNSTAFAFVFFQLGAIEGLQVFRSLLPL